MPIYEYKAAGNTHCEFCKNRFEVRQGINDEPLKKCPKCGAEIRRLFSRPLISIIDPLSQKETFAAHTEEEADDLRLGGGFAEDQIWD